MTEHCIYYVHFHRYVAYGNYGKTNGLEVPEDINYEMEQIKPNRFENKLFPYFLMIIFCSHWKNKRRRKTLKNS